MKVRMLSLVAATITSAAILGGGPAYAARSQPVTTAGPVHTAIAAAQARACALEAVIDFADFDALTPDNKQNFALNTTQCVSLIDSLLTAVADKAAVDQLGFALDSVGPIALIVRSRTGLSNTSVVPVLIRANQRTANVLVPSCRPVTIERRTEWVCDAYNGDSFGPDVPLSVVQSKAGQRTSWAVALAVLPTLNTL